MGNSIYYCTGDPTKLADGCGLGRSHKRMGFVKKVNISPVVTIVQPLKVDSLVKGLAEKTIQVSSKPRHPPPRNSIGTISASEAEQIQQDKSKELTMRDRELIAKCWRKHIQTGRRDIFHKTMLFCIEASPKLNEIIACQHYCFRDLTKWPKLDRICKAQFNFFEKLIYELNMDERQMREACTRLGETHANYAQYGMKPHFLDIYHQQLLGLISNLPFDDPKEKQETVAAYNTLISFIIDTMNQAYSQKVCAKRNKRPSRAGLT